MSGGVCLGFLSHLVLDEIYSVEWSGVHVRLNKFAESVKFVGKNAIPNLVTYSLLMVLTYVSLVLADVLRMAHAGTIRAIPPYAPCSCVDERDRG